MGCIVSQSGNSRRRALTRLPRCFITCQVSTNPLELMKGNLHRMIGVVLDSVPDPETTSVFDMDDIHLSSHTLPESRLPVTCAGCQGEIPYEQEGKYLLWGLDSDSEWVWGFSITRAGQLELLIVGLGRRGHGDKLVSARRGVAGCMSFRRWAFLRCMVSLRIFIRGICRLLGAAT